MLTVAVSSVCVTLFAASPSDDLARWVDPFIGTEATGNCFPGPCRPFGLVQPSPDTGTKVTCGGYKFFDKTIRGFSQTHLNGTGRPAMGDVAVLPIVESQLKSGKCLVGFDKSSEVAEVGYYAVTLENGVKCEATATERVAIWRFTWPRGAKRTLGVDAAAMLMQSFNVKYGATVLESTHELRGDSRGMQGYKKALGWTPYKLFYAIEFSEPWAKIEQLPCDPFQGSGDRWVVEFAAAGTSGTTGTAETAGTAASAALSRPSLEVRVALSTVSEAGAQANFRAEAQGKSFEEVRAECRSAWNDIFARAQLVKGTDEQKKNWYTALYHLCIQPNLQSDVDGMYRGADDKIHFSKRGHYSTFSLWDTFRAAHPLYTIIVPERVPGFVDSLVAFGREHGHLPMWTMWNGESHCMVGIHSIPVIVDACKKNLVPGLSTSKSQLLTLLVQSMINNDGENTKNCWNAYWENGYIPHTPGQHDQFVPRGQSVSTTLELAYDWWCIAHYAGLIGDEASAAKAQKWADCWKNVFDREIGFARGRGPMTDGGKWRDPFDPADPRKGGIFWSDFTEANSWIYTWHVFQDPDGLAEMLGGRDKALAKLDEFFATPPFRSGNKSPNNDEGGDSSEPAQIGQYWHGNEPSHHIAYLYSVWGRRDKASGIIGRICREAYRPAPDGVCGNDDCGQMSAWYIFSVMGFYPLNPCTGEYVLGAPQAEEMKLKVGGKTFVVRAKGNGGVRLNGRPLSGCVISHKDVTAGGELEFAAPCD